MSESARLAAVVHPMRHQPDRPWWTCSEGCGDWPCETFRGHVLATQLDRSAIQALMESYYPGALVEIGEADLVDRRLFAWARHGGWRPAGGPL